MVPGYQVSKYHWYEVKYQPIQLAAFFSGRCSLRMIRTCTRTLAPGYQVPTWVPSTNQFGYYVDSSASSPLDTPHHSTPLHTSSRRSMYKWCACNIPGTWRLWQIARGRSSSSSSSASNPSLRLSNPRLGLFGLFYSQSRGSRLVQCSCIYYTFPAESCTRYKTAMLGSWLAEKGGSIFNSQ